MFVDASAIVAIVTREPEADLLTDALDDADAPITSPLAVYEATLGVYRKQRGTLAQARQDVRDLLKETSIRLVAITPEEADGALSAFELYGKGRRHPAQLNMGDCFAYAMAKANQTSLLFKGDDFARTDIEAAAPRPE